MNCQEARDAILEADPAILEVDPAVLEADPAILEVDPAILEADPAILEAESAIPAPAGSIPLKTGGSTPLGRHLQMCPDCRARARAILQGEAHLAAGLVRDLTPPNLDEILERGGGGTATTGAAGGRTGWGISTGRAVRTLIPLAAAAILVVFLGRSPSLPGPTYLPPQEHPGLDVEVPQGKSVAVMETTNPDIAVVWIF